MIKVEDLTLHLGLRCIFENASFTVWPEQKVGVIGKNGVGKTTLFSILLKKLSADNGSCYIPKDWSFAYIEQKLPSGDTLALDFVVTGDHEYWDIQQKLITAEANHDHKTILEAHDKLHLIDGYRVPAKAANILKGLGFLDHEMHQPVNSFSGGWRMRLNLAKTLMARANLILLDEPTNHLDLDAIVWLENWINNINATVLVITHDAAFLDQIANNILLIENKKFDIYKGNYSSYINQKAEALASQQAMYLKQQKVKAHLQHFIDRFKAKASKAKQAQSRMKALAKLPDIAAVQQEFQFQFEFGKIDNCPNPVLHLEKIAFAYPETKEFKAKNIFNKVNFYIRPGSRIALLGLNGAGKSTLMKLLAGVLIPQQGTRQLGTNLKIGYFAQEQAEVLPKEETPFSWFQQITKITNHKEIRSYLGNFAFKEECALQKIKVLSGGERARLALAWIVWQKPHLILLDEPTNHLDLEMRQALALALQSFSGAIVLVSHDRQLISNTADELWWIHNGIVEPFIGDLSDYEQKLKKARKYA